MSDSPHNQTRRPEAARPGRLFRAIYYGGLHTLMVALIASASAAFFTTDATWNAVQLGWGDGAILEALAPGIALHIGLCALVWACLWLAFRRLTTLFSAHRAENAPIRRLKPTGSVITETLIILPVALVLIMGIAQLTLVNIAATLSDLAVIQAARSAWVWLPEATVGRFGVDRPLVLEKARVQAAAILAPVASSDFGAFAKGSRTGYAQTFQKTMGAIYGAQIEGGGGNDVGSYARAQAELKLEPGRDITPQQFSFYLAFDTDGFAARSARKFYNAWAHTEVELAETGDRVGVEMTYNYLCLMPLVAGVFGEYKQVNGENGYFLTIKREYTLRKQVKVNESLPLR